MAWLAGSCWPSAASLGKWHLILLSSQKGIPFSNLGDIHLQDKVNKACAHFEGGIKEVDVRMSVAGGDRGSGAKQQKTEITVYTLSNGVVRAEDVEESMYASIDLVSDKLERKLRKVSNHAVTWILKEAVHARQAASVDTEASLYQGSTDVMSLL